MNVLKFGGTSVGTAESILKVKKIVESRNEPVIVVVSAMGGVTDSLIRCADLATAGDAGFRNVISDIDSKHREACAALLSGDARKETEEVISSLIQRLSSLCEGVCMLGVMPRKTRDEILSIGERLSSAMISKVIDRAVLKDSLNIIKTRFIGKTPQADMVLTSKLIKEEFKGYEAQNVIAVVPGFISTDSVSGDITNLGRGGSDYTASLIAAALDAESLEIWTDVDGFMTADPKIIHTSYVIEEMTYEEALELCNFGAKVVYPPTLYPVCDKKIPVLIKNTFNPESSGTWIKDRCKAGDRLIKGISSVDNISLITLSGTSMVGIVGIDSRIFSTLANESISAFLVSQSASETGISIGVSSKDGKAACTALNNEFSEEIAAGSIGSFTVQEGLAAVAIIGENMKHRPGIAGKLFNTLGRSGISVICFAQVASESNISFVIERSNLRKALNVIHDNFFLSEYQELNLFICGIGTVGGQLIEQIAHQQTKLMKERNLKINIVGISRSTKAIFDRNGLDLSNYREQLKGGIDIDVTKLRNEVIGMNIFNSVFVDCTASADVASLYKDFFEHGISVVAANKIAASSDYEMYRDLKDSALRHGVKFLFETNVGAGLPIINTINDLCNSGDKILKIEAVLSGTLNFIFNTISADVPFSESVRRAKEEGYSEPDPRIDLSGKDVMRKLVILSREAGYKVNQEDVEANLFIPSEFFDCTIEEFWEKLPSLNAEFEERRRQLEKENKRLRFVAKMENGKYSVSLQPVDSLHSFYVLDGSNNIILLTTERYKLYPMLIQGYGAGASVTAAGVFADIMSIANI